MTRIATNFRWHHGLRRYWLGEMKSSSILQGISAAFVMTVVAPTPVLAQLPALNEPPWLGHFIGIENKRYHFGLTSMGKITLNPLNERGVPIGHRLTIDLVIGILETKPDGSTTLRQIKPETLQSSDPATDDLKKTVIRGQVTGEASFEATIEHDRGLISIGGRVVDPGTLKNPLSFTVRTRIPCPYPYDKVDERKDNKDFMKKIEDDRLDLKWTDGKRIKQTFEKEVDATSKEMNGPGIAAAQVETSSYKGKKILLTASENSLLTLWNAKPAPLFEGFTFNWVPDPQKDKDGKSRMTLEVK